MKIENTEIRKRLGHREGYTVEMIVCCGDDDEAWELVKHLRDLEERAMPSRDDLAHLITNMVAFVARARDGAKPHEQDKLDADGMWRMLEHYGLHRVWEYRQKRKAEEAADAVAKTGSSDEGSPTEAGAGGSRGEDEQAPANDSSKATPPPVDEAPVNPKRVFKKPLVKIVEDPSPDRVEPTSGEVASGAVGVDDYDVDERAAIVDESDAAFFDGVPNEVWQSKGLRHLVNHIIDECGVTDRAEIIRLCVISKDVSAALRHVADPRGRAEATLASLGIK